ncbi:hypothetical protein AAG570_011753 [Ranatra chinensis]|uniref:Uncharacterized protein n=1 Tax=Ranatra chinensis TaxID=642074 RepID=A0ABD0YV98_9HEMI
MARGTEIGESFGGSQLKLAATPDIDQSSYSGEERPLKIRGRYEHCRLGEARWTRQFSHPGVLKGAKLARHHPPVCIGNEPSGKNITWLEVPPHRYIDNPAHRTFLKRPYWRAAPRTTQAVKLISFSNLVGVTRKPLVPWQVETELRKDSLEPRQYTEESSGKSLDDDATQSTWTKYSSRVTTLETVAKRQNMSGKTGRRRRKDFSIPPLLASIYISLSLELIKAQTVINCRVQSLNLHSHLKIRHSAWHTART